MRLTRTVLPLLVAACAGCGGGGGTTGGTEPGKEVKPGGTTAAANLKDTEAGAKKFAADFLTAVRDRKSNPDQLTVEFKKVFAPHATKGYSDAAAAFELNLLAGEVGADEVTAVAADGGVAFATGKQKGNGQTILRVVKAGSEWKVDWISIALAGVADATLSGDDAPAQFAAQAFLDAVLRKRFELAEAVLTETARNTYGKGTFPPHTFDSGALQNTLKGYFGGFDRYALTKTAKDGPAVVVTVEVAQPGRKQTATLKAVKGTRPGEWLIDAVEVK